MMPKGPYRCHYHVCGSCLRYNTIIPWNIYEWRRFFKLNLNHISKRFLLYSLSLIFWYFSKGDYVQTPYLWSVSGIFIFLTAQSKIIMLVMLKGTPDVTTLFASPVCDTKQKFRGIFMNERNYIWGQAKLFLLKLLGLHFLWIYFEKELFKSFFCVFAFWHFI